MSERRMTRQERLAAIGDALRDAEHTHAVRYHAEALDHLAAIEQDAITAWLDDVPLPEGWTEDSHYGTPTVRYYDTTDDDGTAYERVYATRDGVTIVSTPRHWPAIPREVLIRAAVACSRLREQEVGT